MTTQEWAEAFTAAQSEFPEIKKERTVTVQTRDGGSYSYNYADLPTILELVNPILKSHGLSVAQAAVSENGSIGVETRIFHKSGHVEVFGPLYLPGGGDAKAAGSAVTYARRYSLCAALGIAADEDDDATASSAQANEPVEPVTADDPHCPACLRVHGTLVAVTGPHDKRPYWRCTARPEDCGGHRTHNGKDYSWSGWHKSLEKSVSEWEADVGPKETSFAPNERTGRSGYIVKELMELTGLPTEGDAKSLVKPGLAKALEDGAVDGEAALGGPPSAVPTDDELRAIIGNLTLAEADAVVAAAAEFGP